MNRIAITILLVAFGMTVAYSQEPQEPKEAWSPLDGTVMAKRQASKNALFARIELIVESLICVRTTVLDKNK